MLLGHAWDATMEGFYKEKVAGGKLMSVKIVYDEFIESVEIRGDFFIYPEESLPAIEKSICGHNVRDAESAIAADIESLASKEGIEFVGISPEAIARAVKNAIMSNIKWRVLPLASYPAAMNMGIDCAIMEAVRAGASAPTMRFYTWKNDSVSIGRFQCMEEEVDVKECNATGVDCVRRMTGGGAVYHDSSGEITYSIITPEAYFPKGIRESYMEICGYVMRGLLFLGIEPEFAPINDILANGRKISGNAQTRSRGVILQHGTILYNVDLKKMFSILKVSKEKISDKRIGSAEERVTSVLKERPGTSMEELYNAVLQGFVEGKSVEYGRFSKEEEARASELAEKVYKSSDWNFSR